MPEWRIAHFDIAHAASFEPNDGEQDGSFDFLVVDVLIPPCLTISLHGTRAVYVDVFTSEDEEGGCILVLQVEGVGLPVCEIVRREREGALYVEID